MQSDYMKYKAQLQHLLESRARWNSRLRRAVNAIAKMDRAIKRVEAKMAAAKLTEKLTKETKVAVEGNLVTVTLPKVDPPHTDDLDIPAQFRRPLVNEADEKAKAEILAALTEKKAVKAKGSKARSKAKIKGQLRKMPLSGKDALKAIHSTE